MRDLMFKGPLHFVELTHSAEGISTNVLTARLNKLQQEGLVEKQEDESGSKHLKYALTEKGNALLPVFTEIIAWSGNWDKDSKVPAGFLNRIKADRASIGLQDVREMHNSIESN
ncbi:helix-turn-helix domain-containing protein [Roseibium porphyridii]|uniref:Helix-turn-helix domain-containing protein n=1 Tax=Roseibium porphyridii TaxID=2866279 RepID=A0ABY8F2X3_9HYPH|nr:helix-turn-helix domain-containing protein [Roseibium sp. KMA01]WFE89816.1 helix-turn-helix domain-containing protein [Roseibium sp. KMA01]